MKSFTALVIASLVMTTPIAASPAKRSCVSGTYKCMNPVANTTSTVQVCNNGAWLLAAVCGAGQKCVQGNGGSCTCQPS